MVEVSPEFLAAIGGTILLMLLFLMVVVLWDIALALRDVAEKIDYLEDDVDSDLATINGTLTRIYDRMGGGSSSPVDAGVPSDGGVAGGSAAGASTAGTGVARGGASGGDAAGGGGAGTGVGGVGATTHGPAGAGMAGNGAAGASATDDGATNASATGTTNASEAAATSGSGVGAAGPVGGGAGSEQGNEPAVDPGTVAPISDDADAAAGADAGTDESTDAIEAGGAVEDAADGAGDGADDSGTAADDPGTAADDRDDETTSAPSPGSDADGPSPDADGGNVGRFASDGMGGTAWYEIEFDLPPGSRTGTDSTASTGTSAASPESPAGDDDRDRTGEGPFGLQRPGLRSQLESPNEERAGPAVAEGEREHGPAKAFGGEDIGETTVTDVATVSLADLHGDDAAGEDDADAGSSAEDVLGTAAAEPSGTGADELADALERQREDATEGDGDDDAATADDDAATADDDAADGDGGDIAELVNRELDTLTQEVGGTSMTPDVSGEALDGAVGELDDGSYTFPLSGSAFQVGATSDAETATLRFTPEDPVELDGARERLLKYQLRNYLDRDDTAHAELSVDGGTVVLDIPGADGPAVDAWADAAVQIIDRTLYLSKDDE